MGVGEQEAAQRSPLGVVAVRFVPEPDEHLLHDLLGPGMVVEQSLGQPEGGAGVASIRLGERGLLIPTDRHDERRVGSLGVLTFHIVCTLQGVLPDDVPSRLFQDGLETNLVTVST